MSSKASMKVASIPSQTIQLLKKYKHINWALVDQAMVSGVNFLTGIMTARFLGLKEFGTFTLVWAVVLFFHGLQLAIIVNPMMTIGPKQSSDKLLQYYGAVFTQQIAFCVLGVIFIFLGSFSMSAMFPHLQILEIVPALIVVTVAFQSQDFLRKYLFTRQRGHLAFINDGISYIGQLLLLLWCFKIFQ